MREEGDRGRPAEEGGHKPLKFSLNAETRAALDKVKKKQPASRFIEEVIQPLARQFDPGPSSPLALEIIEKIRSERDGAFKREDIEEVVALDYLLLRVKPALDPFIAMSEPEVAPQSDAGANSPGAAAPPPLAPSDEDGMFSAESAKIALGRLYHILDFLTIQFESVFFLQVDIVDFKLVRFVRRPRHMTVGDALKFAGLTSDEFDSISYSQFAHELKEERDMISRALTRKHPEWAKEVRRSPDARAEGLWVPDRLLSNKVNPTADRYKEDIVAIMAPQFAMLATNLSSARETTNELRFRYPELSRVLRLLGSYEAFFKPGLEKGKEYEERARARSYGRR